MSERKSAGHRRTGIAARASSRWTESDRAALEHARARMSARETVRGVNGAPASDRTAGASRTSRAPTIFRHTIREAFGAWLAERERETKPSANAADGTRTSLAATAVPDVSAATRAKVRAWVRARRAKTKAMASPETSQKLKRRATPPSDVFVFADARAAARTLTTASARAHPDGARSSRFAGYVTRCAHLAFGFSARAGSTTRAGRYRADADEPGYFEERTSRWVPARAARRVVVATEARDPVFRKLVSFGGETRTRRAAFVCCDACHDAFAVLRALSHRETAEGKTANACRECGACVPRSATAAREPEGDALCVFCVFARKRSEKQKNRRRRVRADDGFETSRLGASETVTDDEEDAANHRVVTNPDDDLAPVPPMIQPQCAFLDADDVPSLDALRAAVAGPAPRVALAWDAVARRARNAETNARRRAGSPSGSNRGAEKPAGAARPLEMDAPTGDEAVNWGFLHAGMPPPLEADDFPARHARAFR